MDRPIKFHTSRHNIHMRECIIYSHHSLSLLLLACLWYLSDVFFFFHWLGWGVKDSVIIIKWWLTSLKCYRCKKEEIYHALFVVVICLLVVYIKINCVVYFVWIDLSLLHTCSSVAIFTNEVYCWNCCPCFHVCIRFKLQIKVGNFVNKWPKVGRMG